jgi:hypothetical protein
MENTDVFDSFIVGYLSKRGLDKTAALLLEESNKSIPVFQNAAVSGPAFIEAFCLFRTWYLGTIDFFREELKFISFSIFVRWY